VGLKAPRLSLILVAVVFALSCFGFTLFVWKSFGGPTPLEAHGYRFHILFGSEASQLTPNADVRISGVNVGKVISVKRRGLGADALVEMESRFAPIPKDSRAIIRFKTLLGETFVEMSQGSRTAARLPENGILPRKQVAPVQQVDRVLGSFDEPTRAAFKRFLTRTAKALDQRGPDLNSAIGHAAPTTESAADLVEILDRQRGALRGLINDSGTALTAVGTRAADLQSLVRASNQVFSATAQRNENLTQTVKAFPKFLDDTREALVQIDGAAKDGAPTLRALRPVIPLIVPALRETRRLAPVTQDLFEGLRPAIAAGRKGLPAVTDVLDAAKPALDVLDVAGSYLIPLADYVKAYRTDVITWLAKLGTAANYLAPNGQRMARLLNPIDEETIVGYEQRNASNRHNAYTLPGEIARLASTSVRAFDCRNTSNPQQVPVIGTGTPDCQVQPPLAFRGLTKSFPQLEPAETLSSKTLGTAAKARGAKRGG
jgi:virulence factor Mce-like protein